VTNDDVEYIPEASIINPNPVTNVAAAGLTPRSPVIAVTPVVEIPVFARITKLPDVPRFTAIGLEAMAAFAIKASTSINPKKQVHRFKISVVCVVYEVFIRLSM
jgi:hypothetical protein